MPSPEIESSEPFVGGGAASAPPPPPYRASRARRSLRAGKHADSGHELGVLGGLAGLSLDALSSV
ncbi:MAG: hypothetical protein ACYCUM_14490, partial [Solirubrobacteraceae bacterium]